MLRFALVLLPSSRSQSESQGVLESRGAVLAARELEVVPEPVLEVALELELEPATVPLVVLAHLVATR